MSLRFGTDGVRGRAFDELTPADLTRLGRAVALGLDAERVVIGRDPRESGPEFVAALVGGLAAEGAVADSLGVAPTPAVAWVAAADHIPGIVVSASHNPWHDNGVKVFAAGGTKLDDHAQSALEAQLAAVDAGPVPAAAPRDGSARLDDYVASVIGTVGERRLDGLRVVLDCANGAASKVAPSALASLGAEVITIHADPDGRNINEHCGSTHPGDLQQAVLEHGADAGLAFDGDADRVLGVDETGRLVDGDHILAMCAIDLFRRGLLVDDTVVVTVMTNLGFHLAMAEHGIRVVQTPVGDRHVLAELAANGWSLGGEQSGHVIFAELASTGDGLLTGLELLDLRVRAGGPLSELAASAMTQLPQVLVNVEAPSPVPGIVERLAGAIADAESRLGDRGRVLLRPSGTEPLVRVMVEAPVEDEARAVADELARAVREVLAAGD